MDQELQVLHRKEPARCLASQYSTKGRRRQQAWLILQALKKNGNMATAWQVSKAPFKKLEVET
jgi:hypothetical protein